MAVVNERKQIIPAQPASAAPTLRQQVSERDRLTQETGHYYGITELSLRDADPIKYERFYNKLHAAVLAARESARFVAASPGSREMGECLWGITTPEGDTLAVSMGFLSHTAIFPVAIRYMADNDYDVNDGIEDGDVYAVSDGKTGGVPHPGDFYSFTSIVHDGEVLGWAVGINHLMENGAPVAGSTGAAVGSSVVTMLAIGAFVKVDAERRGDNVNGMMGVAVGSS